MDPFGKKELISFYDRHLKDFGDHPQAVRWTPGGQVRRYEILLDIAGECSGKKVLDFGCGKGDFYGFLKRKSIHMDYCGIDINRSLIDFAERKYPEAEFLALDIEEDTFDREFDIIFICGVFNLRVGGIRDSVWNVLSKVFSLCREALHFNGLSSYTAWKDVELYYLDPAELVSFSVTELSPHILLRHGLIKGDFFLSVYR